MTKCFNCGKCYTRRDSLTRHVKTSGTCSINKSHGNQPDPNLNSLRLSNIDKTCADIERDIDIVLDEVLKINQRLKSMKKAKSDGLISQSK